MKKWIVGVGIFIIGCDGNPPRAPYLPIFKIPESITICEGEEIQIPPQPIDTERYSYQWSPEEIFSNPTSPVQTIKGEKDLEIYLKVTDRINKISITKSVKIKVNPKPSGSAGDDKVICGGESVEIGEGGSSDCTYFWTPQETLDNPDSPITLAHPLEDTVYTLTIKDKETGCSFLDSVTVFVNPPVYAYFVPPAPQCLKDIDGNYRILNFQDMSTGAVLSYLWDFGDGNISELKNPSHIFSNDGSYNVSLSVMSAEGCNSAYRDVVTIFPVPTIFSIISPESRCGPGEVRFEADVGGGTPPYT